MEGILLGINYKINLKFGFFDYCNFFFRRSILEYLVRCFTFLPVTLLYNNNTNIYQLIPYYILGS